MAGRNNPKTGGRKLGTPNKNKGQHAAAIREALEGKGITPLQFMLAVMRDPAQPPFGPHGHGEGGGTILSCQAATRNRRGSAKPAVYLGD